MDKATETVPDSLYNHPHFEQGTVFDDYGMPHTQEILVENDFFNNAPLDKERRKLIKDCMQSKGWKNDHWNDQESQ